MKIVDTVLCKSNHLNDPTLRKLKSGLLATDTHRQCTQCNQFFKKPPKDSNSWCPTCNTMRVKNRAEDKKMLSRARNRAAKRGCLFEITLEDINIPKICPILGIELKHDKGTPGGNKNSPSLDKIIPEKGYVKGNVRVISQLANAMKANATDEELLLFAKWIYKTHNSGEENNESSLT
jgi:predicted  nucleic acid-binding Zn-ribbon protein